MLEFITPPVQKRGDEILFLESAHHFTHHNIQGQKLWPFSVAPFTKDDEDIPIAYYGESNLAKFKELYRLGLSNRYGRPMQAISGIHFNYSFNDSYIKHYKLLDFNSSSASNDQLYLNTLRNIYRTNWLILYLFGSSPVVSNNLITKNETDALSIDSEYSYFPEATSLRMSDLGYQNTINEFEVCLNSLEQYTESLIQATNKFCNKFENIDLHSQINSNILQIEDEYYSAARPKNSALSAERLSKKLIKCGIEYIELRSLDLDPFEPIGINLKTLLFLEVFMIFSSITESPNITKSEFKEIKQNDLFVSRSGRKINHNLLRHGNNITIKNWGSEMLYEMLNIAELLDTEELNYTQVIVEKMEQINDPSQCPSAKFLDKYLSSGMPYFDFGFQIADINQNKFLQLSREENEHYDMFIKESKQSLLVAKELENNDSVSFQTFLKNYFQS